MSKSIAKSRQDRRRQGEAGFESTFQPRENSTKTGMLHERRDASRRGLRRLHHAAARSPACPPPSNRHRRDRLRRAGRVHPEPEPLTPPPFPYSFTRPLHLTPTPTPTQAVCIRGQHRGRRLEDEALREPFDRFDPLRGTDPPSRSDDPLEPLRRGTALAARVRDKYLGGRGGAAGPGSPVQAPNPYPIPKPEPNLNLEQPVPKP